MKKFMAVAVIGMASLLGGCNEGIYGEDSSKQDGVRLDIQKDVIKFKDSTFNVKSWDESQKPVYIAKTQNKDIGSWTFKIEKVKQGVMYQGVVFEKD